MPTYEVTKTIILTLTMDAASSDEAFAWVKDCDDDLTGEGNWDDRHEELECHQVKP